MKLSPMWGLREKTIVHNLILHCKRLFPQLEPMTTRSHGSNFTVPPRLPFLMVKYKDKKNYKDYKVILRENLTAQQKLVMLNTCLEHDIRRRKMCMTPIIKWWMLKNEKQNIFKEIIEAQVLREKDGDSNITWDKMASNLHTVAKNVLNDWRGQAPPNKNLSSGIRKYKRN